MPHFVAFHLCLHCLQLHPFREGGFEHSKENVTYMLSSLLFKDVPILIHQEEVL